MSLLRYTINREHKREDFINFVDKKGIVLFINYWDQSFRYLENFQIDSHVLSFQHILKII
jgi:hypothetical protein